MLLLLCPVVELWFWGERATRPARGGWGRGGGGGGGGCNGARNLSSDRCREDRLGSSGLGVGGWGSMSLVGAEALPLERGRGGGEGRALSGIWA